LLVTEKEFPNCLAPRIARLSDGLLPLNHPQTQIATGPESHRCSMILSKRKPTTLIAANAVLGNGII
jgi:hypothetical protein